MRKNISVQKIGVEVPEIGGQKARGKKTEKKRGTESNFSDSDP